MTDFLDRVVAERRADYEGAQRGDASVEAGRGRGKRVDAGGNTTRPMPLSHAILSARGFAVIAEIKRLSPAGGELRRDVDPVAQARVYEAAGACAISVLTEPRHWGGSLDDLARVHDALPHLPLLCKDVVVSGRQLVEASVAGATAVLLIAEALSDAELRALMEDARRLSLEPLVEAHEPAAFLRAVRSGARIVGVNARNLRDPREIDRGRIRLLHTFVRSGQLLVAESGIESVNDVLTLPARANAVLVGSALMRASDPGDLVRALVRSRPAPPGRFVERATRS